MRLALFLSLFICPKDTARCGEASSLHVLIDVLIDVLIFNREVVMEIKSPGRWFKPPARAGLMIAYPLQQIEFLSPADGRPAVVHPQLFENVIGMGAQSVERHYQLLGNFWAA